LSLVNFNIPETASLVVFFSSTSGFVETVDDIKTDSLEVLPSVTELFATPVAP